MADGGEIGGAAQGGMGVGRVAGAGGGLRLADARPQVLQAPLPPTMFTGLVSLMPTVAEWPRRTYSAPLGAGGDDRGVGLIPANSDAQSVPSFRRWRFEMKLSSLYLSLCIYLPLCVVLPGR